MSCMGCKGANFSMFRISSIWYGLSKGIELSKYYGASSHDVTAAILVFQKKKGSRAHISVRQGEIWVRDYQNNQTKTINLVVPRIISELLPDNLLSSFLFSSFYSFSFFFFFFAPFFLLLANCPA